MIIRARCRSRRLIFPFLLLGLAGCAGFKKVNIFTVPQEMAIGEVFSSEVEAMYPVLLDPKLDWYLNHRGRAMVELSDRSDIPYRFSVVDDPELNAFAIPGGHIYIHLGMFEAAERESELMGVVAHEIGHIIARHSMKTLSQQSIVSIVGTIALNQYPNQWAALAANLFGTTGFLKMSRDAEREADAIGLDLVIRAGYDPHGMARIFEKLLKKYDESPGLLDKLFATHPPTPERIANINAMIEARTLPPGLIDTTPRYQEIYDGMVKTYYSEAGRRRWREVVEKKQDKSKDRLPWDRKADQKEQERKEKEREEREKERRQQQPAPPQAEPAPGTPGAPARPGDRLAPGLARGRGGGA